jgi:hypothetical protein
MATSASPSTGSPKIDAIVQKATTSAPQLSGVGLYSRFALAGAICCSVTHGALTPVDVYVCRYCPVGVSAAPVAARMRLTLEPLESRMTG